MFKDWRVLDQSPVDIQFQKDYVYYVHSRAWALKGWCGGTHSWTTFWSAEHKKWLVVELSDRETLEVQRANVLWIRDGVDYQEHSPVISDRTPNAKWFGSTPVIVGKCLNTFAYSNFVKVCETYPIMKFDLVHANCNTFISYLLSTLNIPIRRPLRSIGFKKSSHWKDENYGKI